MKDNSRATKQMLNLSWLSETFLRFRNDTKHWKPIDYGEIIYTLNETGVLFCFLSYQKWTRTSGYSNLHGSFDQFLRFEQLILKELEFLGSSVQLIHNINREWHFGEDDLQSIICFGVFHFFQSQLREKNTILQKIHFV